MPETHRPIYFDNAATSFPKPPGVAEAMDALLRTGSLSPGRSAHAFSLKAGRIIFEARETLAELFNCADSSRVIFAANVTESLNIGIMGLLRPGDHVITTGMEHNSVMRPLRQLERSAGVEISIMPTAPDGAVSADDIPRLLKKNTRLIVVNHVSNVTGTVASLKAIGERKGPAVFMVDAAQSAGVFPIDVEAMHIDFLGFTGHKSLFGPTGTGGFFLRQGVVIPPFYTGGTGSNSELEEQPQFLPDCYESGTPNTLGIAGLAAGLEFIRTTGIDTIRRHEQRLAALLLDGLGQMPGITVYGPPAGTDRGAVVSLRIGGKSVSEVARELDRVFHVMARPGLHCAPAAHRSIGTFPEGTLRISFGFFNTKDEVRRCLEALDRIRA